MSARGAGILVALALSACAYSPTRTPQTAACRDYFEALDTQVARAGVRDAGAFRIDGFPYLRIERFTASFAAELSDEPRWQLWFELLRQRDHDARRAELQNLGTPDLSRVLDRVEECGRTLVQYELTDPPARARVRKAAVNIPDEYSFPARLFGAYPLAVPFLHLGIRGYHDDVADDYARPLEALDHAGTLVRWEPPATEAPAAADVKAWFARTDPLGIPKLTAEHWQRLSRAHAPTWWIEQAGDYDRPGAPVVDAALPSVDASQPVTYFQPAYARFAGKVLVQLVYTVWFSERPRQKRCDGYAGPLDGVVWRVTLDADGQPLLYDTIHACGCYHLYFPAWPAARRPQGGLLQERALFPQKDVPKRSAVAVRLQSGTHYVRRVVPAAVARSDKVQRYQLAPYSDLLSIEGADGKRRSLFGEDAIVRGSQRAERYWLWVSGVPDPGAMREWGRHPTSFVGKSQFDDPGFLDELFEVPLPEPVE
jgi:hypothetical protein